MSMQAAWGCEASGRAGIDPPPPRRVRLAYVSREVLVPTPLRAIASEDAEIFRSCLRKRVRRLTPGQAEEFHGVLQGWRTDALTDGLRHYTIFSDELWEVEFPPALLH